MKIKVDNMDELFLRVETGEGELYESDETSHSSRYVYLFDKFVVKFDKMSSIQNKAELKFYTEILEDEDRQFFPKLLASFEYDGGLVLVQERTDDVSGDIPQDVVDLANGILYKYDITDIIFEKGVRVNAAYTANKEIKIYDIGWFHGGGEKSEDSYYDRDES